MYRQTGYTSFPATLKRNPRLKRRRARRALKRAEVILATKTRSILPLPAGSRRAEFSCTCVTIAGKRTPCRDHARHAKAFTHRMRKRQRTHSR